MKEENIIDCVENFENYYKYIIDEENKKIHTKEEWGYIWLCGLFATFYDDDMDLKWGKLLYKTLNAIIERIQIVMIESRYEEYLLCLNLIGVENLDWGTSIRFCWFENDEFERKCKNYIKQIKKIEKENKNE